jgi:hypothetical protein
MGINSVFGHSCMFGQIEVAKWLLITYHNIINIYFGDNWAFNYSCLTCKMEVCKWLWELDEMKKIDIHIKDDWLFTHSLINGHIHIAKWLWEMDNTFNLHGKKNWLFYQSFRMKLYDVLNFLVSLDDKFVLIYYSDKHNVIGFYVKDKVTNAYDNQQYKTILRELKIIKTKKILEKNDRMDIDCPICFESMDNEYDIPMLKTPCNHSICIKCLTDYYYIRKNKLKCIICRDWFYNYETLISLESNYSSICK